MLSVLVLVLGMCGHAFGQNPAGMILYFESGGEVYLLLAENSREARGWQPSGEEHRKARLPRKQQLERLRKRREGTSLGFAL